MPVQLTVFLTYHKRDNFDKKYASDPQIIFCEDLIEMSPRVSTTFISLVTSCLALQGSTHKQSLPCPQHGSLTWSILWSWYDKLHPINLWCILACQTQCDLFLRRSHTFVASNTGELGSAVSLISDVFQFQMCPNRYVSQQYDHCMAYLKFRTNPRCWNDTNNVSMAYP